MLLYYYTSPSHLRQNLQNKRLKVSRFGRYGGLNDPFELAPYDITDREIRRVHKEKIDLFAQKMGLICMSKTWQSPGMWGHYTENHSGACLELEVDHYRVFGVNYQDEKLFKGQKGKDFLKNVTNENIMEVYGTKSSDFKFEKEWRLHVPLGDEKVIQEGKFHFLPFHDEADAVFTLKRIIVGYRCALGIENLENDVSDYPSPIEVVQSRPAFGDFEVTIQRNKRYSNMQAPKSFPLPAEKALFGAPARKKARGKS